MELTTTQQAEAPGTEASIAAFAAAVRERLDDLPADDADELVDGLEADLADQAIDRGDDFALGDPDAYATELRAAAGIPARVEGAAPKRKAWAWLTDGLRAVPQDAAAAIRRNRAGAWSLDLLIALRPVWWLARGWALYAMLAPAFGIFALTPNQFLDLPGPFAWLLLGGFVVLSVQWGRGRWAPGTWGRIVRVAVSVVTAVALPFLVAGSYANARSWQQYDAYVEQSEVPGLAVDGVRVRNLFAYDAEGKPLDGVQLFDQDGRPLTTVGTLYVDSSMTWDEYFAGGGGPVTVPFTAPGRQALWNVFPLDEILDPSWESPDLGTAVQPAYPFVQVPAVDGVLPSPSPEPTESAAEGTPSP